MNVFDGDPPDCPDCGHVIGTNGSCALCLYAYEANLAEIER